MARTVWRVKPRFWLLLMALVLSVFFGLYTAQEALIASNNAQIEELRQRKAGLEIEIASAERKLEFSKSDDYIERMARSMGMVKENEVLYVLPPEQ